MLIDTHAHLLSNYYDDLEILLNNYKEIIVINCGSSYGENQEILKLCKKHTNVYGALGIHPHNVAEWNEEVANFIEKNLQNEKIVALGEIGLDYHYGVNPEKQKEIFRAQLEIAKRHGKPVIVHSRDAAFDTLSILRDYPDLKRVVHSFSYDLQTAKEFISINCLVGVNGIVTFKKNQPIADVVANIDLTKILAETDSPYLAPVPFRGKKNDSEKIIHVIDKIAEIKGITRDEARKQLNHNACEIFDLNLKKC